MSIESSPRTTLARAFGSAQPSGVTQALSWIRRYFENVDFRVQSISFSDSGEWFFDEQSSALSHRSGKFFSIRGYRFEQDGKVLWQPLIDQPEIGSQGFILRQAGSRQEVLLQARTEPGNIGVVQIGPTLQATYSNYTAVHGGKRPRFLDAFHEPEKHDAQFVLDTTQPELGTRFLKKWNRNIVIESDAYEDSADPMFQWISLRDLARLMLLKHVVNNDARLVFGLLGLARGAEWFCAARTVQGMSVHASLVSDQSISFDNLQSMNDWVETKRHQEMDAPDIVSLQSLKGWSIENDEISSQTGQGFGVRQFRVRAGDREVKNWDQPLVTANAPSRITIYCTEAKGTLNILMRSEIQIGNANGPVLQPTEVDESICENSGPQSDFAAKLKQVPVKDRFEFEASDEGGRFFQCINRYSIIWLKHAPESDLPGDYCWVTLGQAAKLVEETDFVSDESRSIIALLLAKVYANEPEFEN